MPERLVDIPIESLPFVDEYYLDIAATTEDVWEALLATMRGYARGSARPIARALGCAQTETRGEIGRIGSTIPGFVVTRSVRPVVLALMGQHRFSRYALIFRIVEKPSGLVLLSAQTRAEFPGAKGKAYRGLVIGTRGHVLVTRSIMRSVRRRAERMTWDDQRRA
ncbi:MAG TPA: hypothetical protein VIL04_08325 [Solirubrobacterales bacterium]